ncbi:hypothetical protein TIN2_91 [Tsukamurella phage TIN2]|uniref:Uncharacterized protein n=1 Tax=Tsukamurella phage TIN2 TaxID=1636545 RepID=A0A0K0N5B5_9CAUD|nr:hypothetical protein AVT55_gp032 [Tsukamurella phage TIN2]AKJ71781.1 hypothetical protein TIN2_91 [Tsukamurella phage TIN2]
MSDRTDVFTADDTEFDASVEQAPEATEPTAEEKEAKQAAADAEHLPAVDNFTEAVEKAVEEADADTGTVTEANLDAVSAAYRAVTGGIKYKNLAKNYVNDQMKAALPAGEYIKAVSYNEISDRLLTTKAEPKPAAPKVDPAVAFAERVAALEIAREVLVNTAPDEVQDFEPLDIDIATREAEEYIEWSREDEETRGDAPEISPVAAAAVKLVQGKGLGKGRTASGAPRAPFTGVRRNVAAHIESAFDGVASGTFLTVSEIVKHSSEEYGDDHPSSGAVSARLFGKSGVEGVTPGENEQGVKGATKD